MTTLIEQSDFEKELKENRTIHYIIQNDYYELVKDKIICPICNQICDNPQTSMALESSSICLKCVENWVPEGNVTKEEIQNKAGFYKFFPNLGLSTIISELKFKCKYGCGLSFTLPELESHFYVCGKLHYVSNPQDKVISPKSPSSIEKNLETISNKKTKFFTKKEREENSAQNIQVKKLQSIKDCTSFCEVGPKSCKTGKKIDFSKFFKMKTIGRGGRKLEVSIGSFNENVFCFDNLDTISEKDEDSTENTKKNNYKKKKQFVFPQVNYAGDRIDYAAVEAQMNENKMMRKMKRMGSEELSSPKTIEIEHLIPNKLRQSSIFKPNSLTQTLNEEESGISPEIEKLLKNVSYLDEDAGESGQKKYRFIKLKSRKFVENINALKNLKQIVEELTSYFWSRPKDEPFMTILKKYDQKILREFEFNYYSAYHDVVILIFKKIFLTILLHALDCIIRNDFYMTHEKEKMKDIIQDYLEGTQEKALTYLLEIVDEFSESLFMEFESIGIQLIEETTVPFYFNKYFNFFTICCNEIKMKLLTKTIEFETFDEIYVDFCQKNLYMKQN